MQRHQQEQLLRDQDSMLNLEHSFNSQPTSRFTVDSASAKFAASAVRNSAHDLLTSKNVLPVTPTASFGANLTTSSSILSTNGPNILSSAKTSGLSTSPAATVLELNFPLGTGVASPIPMVTSVQTITTATTKNNVPSPVVKLNSGTNNHKHESLARFI